MRRIHVIVALAVVVVVAVGVWLALPVERFAVGVAAVAEGEAIMLTRHNADDGTEFWAQLVRSDGSIVWNVSTDGLHPQEALGFTGAVASGDRVALLGVRDGSTVVFGLERTTGARVWEAILGAGERTFYGNVLLVDGPRAYAIHDASERTTITALALADGTVQWTFDAAAQLDDPRILGATVISPDRIAILLSGADTVAVDGTSGRVIGPLPMKRLACETPDALIGWSDDTIVRAPRAEGADVERIAVAVRRPFGDPPCGERGESVVVGAATDDGAAVLVRVDPRARSVQWTLPLPGEGFGRVDTQDGRLPRVLPLAVYGGAAGSIDERIVVVDLDAGTILSEHPHEDTRTVIATAERAFVVSDFGPTIFALDPERGTLERVVRFEGDVYLDARVEDFRFGELWLTGMGVARPSGLDWAVFDLRSATATTVHGQLVARDVTASGWAGR